MIYDIPEKFELAKEGIIKLNFEPDLTDNYIEFYKDGKFLGIGLRNGHHLNYNQPELRAIWPKRWKYKNPSNKFFRFLLKKNGYHSLPYILYYFGFKKVSPMKKFCLDAIKILNLIHPKDFGAMFVDLKMEFVRNYQKGLITSTFHDLDFFKNVLFGIDGGDLKELGEPAGEYRDNFKKLIELNK